MKRKGFTLIELLVVVAIIAALLAILMPSMGKAMARAQAAVCLSNIHQQSTAMFQYFAESRGIRFPSHRDYAPYAISNYQDAAAVEPATGFNLNSWHYAMFDYIADANVMLCPLLTRQGGSYETTRWWASSDTTYGGWNAHEAPDNAAKKHARWIATPYDWYAGFTDYWNTRPTFPTGAIEWPFANQAQPGAALIGHSVLKTLTGIDDRSHGGLFSRPGLTINKAGSTEVPIGYFDGSAGLNPRSQWRERATWHQSQLTAYY